MSFKSLTFVHYYAVHQIHEHQACSLRMMTTKAQVLQLLIVVILIAREL